jgi:hypothetical protein
LNFLVAFPLTSPFLSTLGGFLDGTTKTLVVLHDGAAAFITAAAIGTLAALGFAPFSLHAGFGATAFCGVLGLLQHLALLFCGDCRF